MSANDLSTIVALIGALSVASERLVEIIKGMFPSLEQQSTDPVKEGHRRAKLQALAVVAGIITTFLASPAIKGIGPIKLDNVWGEDLLWILALGFLASGGSGFWNSIATYLNKVKDIKKAEAEKAKIDADAKKKEADKNPV